MKKIFSLIVLALFCIPLISSGQVKQITPNFTNPFQQKIIKNNNTVIIPNGNQSSDEKQKVEIINGSVWLNLKKKNIDNESLLKEFNSWVNLSSKHTFQKIAEKNDDLGFIHINYQQLYKGVPVYGGILMVHIKDGIVSSINGKILEVENFDIQILFTKEQALIKAKTSLEVTDLINEYPVETIIYWKPDADDYKAKLAYKVRIDSYSPFLMYNVLVDATTGEVLNKISLIADADVPGTANTLYSGTQNITCDSYGGSYRLRESGRNIETYNATSATGFTTSGFTGSTDFINSSANWAGNPRLTSFTISNVSQSWWYNSFIDQTPDLYIIVKNGSNQIVHYSNPFLNTFPIVTFNNINVFMSNPPYTVELWEFDVSSSDDFGGSFILSANNGTQSWSVNGNNGIYDIGLGDLATDVHWGMEKTYDYYLTIHGRNSYDNNGGVIKNYINPPTLQSQNGNDPNNAYALGSPYNIMSYGLGDGTLNNPVVGLDVEGHEFTHLVVDNNGNGGLDYQGESGALNESFGDIFGTCIEFYSGVNPDWTIGEDIFVSGTYMRSMSNPNAKNDPNTYNGQYWINPNSTQDHGGVHTNSGVQNHWFYLLSQGGSGTNDIGNSYTVTGIGMNDASKIAYRNLIIYLPSNATYFNAYYGSLQSADDLYGNPSAEYTAVQEAWYAVGIGNSPNSYCSGTTNLTAASGTITDGSGSADYNNNSDCKWVIAPAGATQIGLTFTYFDTEANYDTVFVYDGPSINSPLLATLWGNSIPQTLYTTSGTGAMCIRFTSDVSINEGGWSANYQVFGNTPSCSGGTILSSPTGSFNDGSGSSNYGNNQICYWYIAPPCANSVTLSFSSFNTELNYDGLVIYDDLAATNQIAVYSGNNIPNNITSTTGEMVIVFSSDFMDTYGGFYANYTSTGNASCAGVSTLNTSDYGPILDGSGTNNYCNNLDCFWLIQPPQATSVTLNFTSFDLELPASDGTVYDAVEIFDGINTSSPSLGIFSGNNIPPSITSTTGSMLVRFYSDLEVNSQGWDAYYTSTQAGYCSGTTTLTSSSGSFTDGSGSNLYANNSDCSWLIQPPNASSISLSFSSFDTELNYDGVIVYDGANNTSAILGQYSGVTIPPNISSSGGSMYLEFLSDVALRYNGWSANYNSIAPSWNCDGQGNCNDPGTGNGQYSTLSSCQSNCVLPTWNCDGQGNCSDPNTGNGTYSTFSACQTSCITPTWDCISPGNCQDPGTGNGAYTTQAACQSSCVLPTWDCDGQGTCSDPGTGNGTYASYSACQANCVLPTWDCISPGNCQDPGTGNGAYTTQAACQLSCVLPTWNCINENCIDPGTGNGTYASYAACQSICVPTSITEIDFDNISIYPNPTDGIFTIEFTATTAIDVSFSVLNVLGQEIALNKIKATVGVNKQQFDLSGFAKGIYTLKLISENGVMDRKVVLE
ncbi:MAG: Bacillolysin [Flavobacteriaceae bacterium]|jgi:Zn-dependent metalloprotease|nr:MAG: Bacillolysin [Flavobacteriaceae bacterium]|tara:strand:- start:4119 stop:8423 length:4305 start_codon:yes stop_codon:yes gene_type:complete